MAPSRSRTVSLLLVVCMATLLPSFSVADTQSDFLNTINLYRRSKGLPTVQQDAGDECLAQKYVDTYGFPLCNLFTGPYPLELPAPTNLTGCQISSSGCPYDACAVCTPGGIIPPQLLAFYTSDANASSICGGALTNGLITKVGAASSSSWLVAVVQPDCTSSPPGGGSNPGLGSGSSTSTSGGSGYHNSADAKQASLVTAGLAFGASLLVTSWLW